MVNMALLILGQKTSRFPTGDERQFWKIEKDVSGISNLER